MEIVREANIINSIFQKPKSNTMYKVPPACIMGMVVIKCVSVRQFEDKIVRLKYWNQEDTNQLYRLMRLSSLNAIAVWEIKAGRGLASTLGNFVGKKYSDEITSIRFPFRRRSLKIPKYLLNDIVVFFFNMDADLPYDFTTLGMFIIGPKLGSTG